MPGRRRTLGSPQEEVTEPRSQEGSGEGGRRVKPGRGGGLCNGPGAGAGGGEGETVRCLEQSMNGMDNPCQDCLHSLKSVEDFLPSEEIHHGLFKRMSGVLD